MNTPGYLAWYDRQGPPRPSPSGTRFFRHVTPAEAAATKGICWSRDGQRSLILTDAQRIDAGFLTWRRR